MDLGLGTVTREEEDAKADTARDEEVEGGDMEAAIDVTLDADATDDLAWNGDDPHLEIDDESSGVHRRTAAVSTPLSIPMKEMVLSPPSSPSLEKPCREILTIELKSIDDSTPDYSDVSLVGFTRPDLTPVLPWVRFKAQNMCEPPWRTGFA